MNLQKTLFIILIVCASGLFLYAICDAIRSRKFSKNDALAVIPIILMVLFTIIRNPKNKNGIPDMKESNNYINSLDEDSSLEQIVNQNEQSSLSRQITNTMEEQNEKANEQDIIIESEKVNICSLEIKSLLINGEYENVLKYDSFNVIALIHVIEEKALQEDFSDVIYYNKYLDQVKSNGMNYSVYPFVILAFDNMQNYSEANYRISLLRKAIDNKHSDEYSYLNDNSVLREIYENFNIIEDKIENNEIQHSIIIMKKHISLFIIN